VDTFALVVAAVVLVGVVGYLVTSMLRHIQVERRSSNLSKIWNNFGLSIALVTLFFVTWIAQAIVQWPVFAQEQQEHGEPAKIADYFLDFSRSTLENWQSEFLQLFTMVVLTTFLIHRHSHESRDSQDRMQEQIEEILTLVKERSK
jgi:hypothetical protein